MSTVTCRDSSSPILFSRRKDARASPITNTMKSNQSRVAPLKINHFLGPPESNGESSTNDTYSNRSKSPRPPRSPEYRQRPRSNINTRSNEHSPKRTYTFSNPPRELQRSQKLPHQNRSFNRVSSAPLEKSSQISPRSLLNQKSYSANQSSTLRSHETSHHHIPRPPTCPKREERQENSLGALIKEKKRSNVPKAVQNRRIMLLIHRPIGLSKENDSSRAPSASQISNRECSTIAANQSNQVTPLSEKSIEEHLNIDSTFLERPLINDPTHNLDPDVVDSAQLAAILADIQSGKDWIPNQTSSETQQKQIDLTRYTYDASSLLETATIRLSPRTLKPNEKIEAKSRSSYYYSNEMRSSSNAQMPSLIASIVTDTNSTIGAGNGLDLTLTVRLHPNGTVQAEKASNHFDSLELTTDSEQIQLFYDATLNGFYDPKTGLYYEVTST